MRRASRVAVILGFVLATGACAGESPGALDGARDAPEALGEDGAGGAGGAAAEYIDAQVESLAANPLGRDLPPDATRCIATAIVDVATVEALEDGGVTPEELAEASTLTGLGFELPGGPDATTDDLAAGLGECDAAGAMEPLLAASLGATGSETMSEPNVDCVTNALDDEAFEDALAATIVVGGEQVLAELTVALEECPAALAELAERRFVEMSGQDLPADAVACLEDEIAGTPGIAERFGAEAIEVQELLADLAAACGIDLDSESGSPAGEAPTPEPPPADTPADAVEVTTLVEGTGDPAALGDTLTVHYVGVLPDGELLDSSWDIGEPFTMTLGETSVIDGWTEGMVGVRVGERRRLVIGFDKAYGPAGNEAVPPNSPLAFEVDVLEITA